MKKLNLFIFTLLFVFFSFLFNNNRFVKALDGFSSKIYVDHVSAYSNGLINYGYGNIYKKHYKKTNSSVNWDGKAYCVSFNAYAPGNVHKADTCSKENWSSNSYNNGRIAAAIGSIIQSAKSSNHTTTWKNYYYAEYAINDFLYKKNLGSKVNKIPYSSISNNSIYKKLYNAGINAYNDYEKYNYLKLEVGSLSISDNVKKGKSGNVSATITCKDKNNKNITCPSLSEFSVSVKVDTKTYSGKIVKNANGKTNINASATINALSTGEHNITLMVAATKKFSQAQRYYCQATAYSSVQKMTPNYTKKVSITKSAKKETKVKISQKSPDSCESELKAKKNLSTLYNKYKKNGLLNLSSPSCKNETSTSSLSCDSSSINNKVITPINNGYLYCDYSYTVNSNLFVNNNSANDISLLYAINNPDDLNVSLSITCNAINISSAKISLSDVLPTININFLNNNYKIKPKLDASTLATSSNVKISNGKINYNGSGNQQFSVSGTIIYDYDDIYGISKKDQKMKKISECGGNCISLGKGVPVNINKSKQGNSDISFIVNGQTTSTVSCPYDLKKINRTESALFRTIDTENPFLTKDGHLRYTGTNWCNFSTNSDDDVSSTETKDITESVDIFSNNGTFLGDINGSAITNTDPAITYYDVLLIEYYLYNKDILTSVDKVNVIKNGDINNDGKITQEDADIIFNGLTNYFITSDARLGGSSNTESILNEYLAGEYGIDSSGKVWWKNGVINAQYILSQFLSDYNGTGQNYIKNIDSSSNCTHICTFKNEKTNKYVYDIMNYIILTYTTMNENKIILNYQNYEQNAYNVGNISNSSAIKKGDVNLDGKVDIEDFNLLNQYIFESVKDIDSNNLSLKNADIDDNGRVNIYDLIRFRDYMISSEFNFNKIDTTENDTIDFKIDSKSYNDSFCTAYTSKNTNDSSIINNTVDKYITKKENSNSKKEPLYSFTLTADNIKKIRKYNKDKKYDDFNLNCENGYKCVSSFVKQVFSDTSYALKSSGKCKNSSINDKFCNVESLGD